MTRNWIKLDPIIPVESSRGYGYAWFILDQGIEHNLQWLVACQDEPHVGQMWVIDNSEIRLCKNATIGRDFGDNLPKTAT